MGAGIILFLLPHAGGSSFQYAGLFPALGEQYRVVCIDLPGHGERAPEPLLHTIPEMVDDVVDQMEQALDHEPEGTRHAVLGHSMGGLLGYLASVRMTERKRPPDHLVVSSTCLPGRHYVPPGLLDLSDDELWVASARHFGGISPDTLACQELQRYFAPLLRADLAAVVDYEPGKLEAVDLPISAFFGERDLVREQDMRAWRRLCTAEFTCRCFDGDHFYLFRRAKEVEACLKAALSPPAGGEN